MTRSVLAFAVWLAARSLWAAGGHHRPPGPPPGGEAQQPPPGGFNQSGPPPDDESGPPPGDSDEAGPPPDDDSGPPRRPPGMDQDPDSGPPMRPGRRPPPGMDEDPDSAGSDDARAGGRRGRDGPAAEAPAGPMSPADAEVNIGTVIETYVRERSPDGYFPLKDMTGKVWSLEFEKVRDGQTRRLKSNLYASCADFHSVQGGTHALDIDFTVDFGADRWKVSEVRIHRVDGQPRFRYDEKNRRVPVSGSPGSGSGSRRSALKKRKTPPADPQD